MWSGSTLCNGESNMDIVVEDPGEEGGLQGGNIGISLINLTRVLLQL